MRRGMFKDGLAWFPDGLPSVWGAGGVGAGLWTLPCLGAHMLRNKKRISHMTRGGALRKQLRMQGPLSFAIA